MVPRGGEIIIWTPAIAARRPLQLLVGLASEPYVSKGQMPIALSTFVSRSRSRKTVSHHFPQSQTKTTFLVFIVLHCPRAPKKRDGFSDQGPIGASKFRASINILFCTTDLVGWPDIPRSVRMLRAEVRGNITAKHGFIPATSVAS